MRTAVGLAFALPLAALLLTSSATGCARSADANAKIAFVSERDDVNGEIYVMNADGSGQRRLTRNRADDDLAAWSPDGRRIAFERGPFFVGPREIYLMNADGSWQRRLTRNPAGDAYPAWSP